ncbi:MAG: hypothetical protein IPM45_11925 [Acidimicrobiales bacterium]|nr:hypothetical protein [Acidimicrobiales bacterium]
MQTLPKPDELLALDSVTAELFDTLRRWFAVPDEVRLDLRAVDSAVRELGDPVLVAAMAMRKLQALNLLATPGVTTTTDVVVTIVGDLDRALVQAPVMRLRLAAEQADWDAELAVLEGGAPVAGSEPPGAVDAADDETERFRQLHARLHEAVRAVIEASEGEIRYFS